MDAITNLEVFRSELSGTSVLILLGVGVNANTSLRSAFGHGRDWLLTAFGWGFAVFVGASIAWSSGAHLNPAVTLSLALTSVTPWGQVPAYMAGQLLGAIIGAVLAYLMYKKQFDSEPEPSTTGGIFFTSPAVRSPLWNTVSEFIATYVLIIWVLQATPSVGGTSDSGPQFANSALGYAGVAFAIIGIGASLGGATGYAINPVRDFGPRLVYALLPIRGKGSADWGYAWVPVVGPMLAAVAAAGVFSVFG